MLTGKMEDIALLFGYANCVRTEYYFACFLLHNGDVEFENILVDLIISEERCTQLKIDRVNTYTTTTGSEVRDTIMDMLVNTNKLLIHNDIIGHFKIDVGFGWLIMTLERSKMLISIFNVMVLKLLSSGQNI